MSFEGNKKHLEVLNKAISAKNIKAWNNFNLQLIADGKCANLQGIDLLPVDLSGINLSKANISHAKLLGIKLRNSNLKETDFNYSNLFEVDFLSSDLCKANFSKGHLMSANFTHCLLNEADMSNSILFEANLTYVTGIKTNFNHANLNKAILSNSILKESQFIEAKLFRAKITDADLSSSALSGAELSEADFTNSNLSEAAFFKSKLNGADLSRTILVKSNFMNAEMNGTNLFQSDMSESTIVGADLRNSNLSFTNLTNTNLSTTTLINAKLDNAIITGGQLWQIQTGNWSIKGIVCEYVFWGVKRTKKVEYDPGDFERFFGGEFLEIEYPEGIEPYQYHTFPTMIAMLNKQFDGKCILTFTSLEQGSGNHKIRISISDIKGDKKEIENQIKKSMKDLEEKYKKKIMEFQETIKIKEMGLIEMNTKLLELEKFLNQTKKQSKVFLSHSSYDKLIVEKIKTLLEQQQIPVWYDLNDLDIGDPLTKTITKGIDESGFIAVFLSKQSIKSKWVDQELRIAFAEVQDAEKKFLPILLEDLEKKEIPGYLRDLLYADLREKSKEQIEAVVNKIIRAIIRFNPKEH